MNVSLIVSVVAAGWLAQQAPAAPAAPPQVKPVSANLKVRIATSTYMPDGRVLTASASDWPLKLNEPVVVYAASGSTMCEPKPATLQEPQGPAIGWRVEITPIREGANELEVLANVRPLGFGVKATKRPLTRLQAGPGATLTLHAGDRIVLDYLNGSHAPGLFVFGNESRLGYGQFRLTERALNTVATSRASCAAVGMSLEVGLEPAKTDALVEAELWLVRPNRDGTERSDRQVLRLPVGHPASRYFFDEARLADPNAGGNTLAKVSGELSAVSIENGKIRFNLNIMRRYGGSAAVDVLSTYRDLVATPGEVVAFKLPADGAPAQPPLSIRLRANVLR
jgi:hypothetical protein